MASRKPSSHPIATTTAVTAQSTYVMLNTAKSVAVMDRELMRTTHAEIASAIPPA